VLEGDNIIRRHYHNTSFTLTQYGENIITSRFPAHLINFSQQSSIRKGEASLVFSADHKLKAASKKKFFSALKDISVAVEAWSVLCSIYGAFESRDIQGIFTIGAAMQVFIDGSAGRPDIILAVFHRMMLSCLDGDSPPGFSIGMPVLATNVMMLASDVPAKDISIYTYPMPCCGSSRLFLKPAYSDISSLLAWCRPSAIRTALTFGHSSTKLQLLKGAPRFAGTSTLPSTAAKEAIVVTHTSALHALLLNILTTIVQIQWIGSQNTRAVHKLPLIVTGVCGKGE
jgi:hypothetical protein